MLNREFNCLRYELPRVYKCSIKTSPLKYKLKWSCNFLLLGVLVKEGRKGSETLHTQHQPPTFCQDFQFFVVKLQFFQKPSDVLLLSVTNITIVLRFKKGTKLCYVQTVKVINSKEAS